VLDKTDSLLACRFSSANCIRIGYWRCYLGFVVEPRQPACREGEPLLNVRHSVCSQVERRGRKSRRQGSDSLLTQHQSDDVRRHQRTALQHPRLHRFLAMFYFTCNHGLTDCLGDDDVVDSRRTIAT